MLNNYISYITQYFLPEDKINNLRNKIQHEELHIFGASGALGLSCLMLFEILLIKPKKIVIYAREKSKLSRWLAFSIKNKVEFEIVKFKENSFDIDLSRISSNSTIYYFLGFAQPQKFMNDPLSLFEINVGLLSKVTLRAPKYIFYTSTSEIYSGLTSLTDESSATISTPQHPRGAYIESKRCGEAILSHLSSPQTKSVSFRVALATPPYPLEDDSRILSDLVTMAKNTGKVSLRGGWDSIRQYQWGPICLAKMLWIGYWGVQKVYNISGGEAITLETLAKEVANHFKVKYVDTKGLEFKSLGAPDYVKISSSRLNDELKVDFQDEKIKDLLSIYLCNFI
jgi:nucleoside-diphosphate-sugar epimerase